ncbi:MAG: hypothetical protein ACVCEJ_04020 [Candidatus Izemoplasmataceae bacterium]
MPYLFTNSNGALLSNLEKNIPLKEKKWYNEISSKIIGRRNNMSFADWVYLLLGGYLILMGLLGVNLKILWLTITFRIKFYDFEDLYGRTFARILFIVMGALVLVFHFMIMSELESFIGI